MVQDLPAEAHGNALRPLEAVPADRHPAAVYLARLAPGSRRTMREALDTIAGILTGGQAGAFAVDWGAVRYQHTAAVRATLAERYSASTTNKTLSALRGVLKEAWRLGLLPSEDYQRATDLSSVKGSTLPAGRAISAGELRALFASCADQTPSGARDAALLGVLYGAGLRRAEAVGLDVEDYNAEDGSLTVHGKGNKSRITYATNGSRAAIAAWLLVRGSESGALFCPINKGGRLTIRRMTEQAVLGIVQKRAARASVAHLSPHDFRRSFVSDLLDAGADLSAVQKLAGHANIQTTARYDRRGEAGKRKAAELLHVPFVGA